MKEKTVLVRQTIGGIETVRYVEVPELPQVDRMATWSSPLPTGITMTPAPSKPSLWQRIFGK